MGRHLPEVRTTIKKAIGRSKVNELTVTSTVQNLVLRLLSFIFAP